MNKRFEVIIVADDDAYFPIEVKDRRYGTSQIVYMTYQDARQLRDELSKKLIEAGEGVTYERPNVKEFGSLNS